MNDSAPPHRVTPRLQPVPGSGADEVVRSPPGTDAGSGRWRNLQGDLIARFRRRDKPRAGMTVETALTEELVRHRIDPGEVRVEMPAFIRRSFVYPAIRHGDTSRSYSTRVMRRVRWRILLAASHLLFVVVAVAAIAFVAYSEFWVPYRDLEARKILARQVDTLLDNTDLSVSPHVDRTPPWLAVNLAPSWYWEPTFYGRTLDVDTREVADLDLMLFLRQQKAIIERESTPAFSNDKVQNRLRDPNDDFLGRDYDLRKQRFTQTVLAVIALARQRDPQSPVLNVFDESGREELISRISSPTPPAPNDFYDDRVVSLTRELVKPVSIGFDEGDEIRFDEETRARFHELAARVFAGVPSEERDVLIDGGLGALYERLGGSSDSSAVLTRFYDNVRERYTIRNILEIRLAMLNLLFHTKLLPLESPRTELYVLHRFGRDALEIYRQAATREVREAVAAALGTTWSANVDLEAEWVAFRDWAIERQLAGAVAEPEPVFRMLYDAARFDQALAMVEASDADLATLPYLGELGLPVARFEPDQIKPWGLYRARRNGYSHEGLDIGGELGSPILSIQDGVLVRADYQANGAGNYIVANYSGLQVMYQHLLRMPSPTSYERLLSAQELAEAGNERERGYQLALRRYASLVLGKDPDALTAEDLDPDNLRRASVFDRLRERLARGEKITVRKGDQIGNMGLSGNILSNTSNRMIYPHLHLEINDGEVDPMAVIPALRDQWPAIRELHLGNPLYRDWLKVAYNWNWYRKLYENGPRP